MTTSVYDTYEVVLVGDEGVGKTLLVQQYANDLEYDSDAVYNTEVIHGRQISFRVDKDEDHLFLDAVAGVLVFDVTDRASFESLSERLAEMQDNELDSETNLMKFVVGNKTDLEERVVSKEEAEAWAQSKGLQGYFEVAATNHDSTCALFHQIATAVVGGTAVHGAAARGDVAGVAEAVNQLQPPHSIDTAATRGKTAMHHAAEFGHVAVLAELVRLGSAAIDTPDKRGCTPMHVAAEYCQVPAIDALVQLGSTAIDTPDEDGISPMHVAATNGHVPAIEALLRLGSTALDAVDRLDNTPLFSAVWAGSVPTIEALVQAGSDIDGRNKNGSTVLSCAAYGHKMYVVEALVRMGSKDIDTPDRYGMTPLRNSWQHPTKTKVLLALGATPTLNLKPSEIEYIRANGTPTEDEVAEIRGRVDFAQSLVCRLLFALASSDREPTRRI